MGIVIFFSMALFIFLGGVLAISLTFRHWIQQWRQKRDTRQALAAERH